MKPVGRKRDIEIAKLQGHFVKGVHICKNKDCNIFTVIPHYSTSWNAAKELWDELPKQRLYIVFDKGNEESHVISCPITGEVIGKDFPDAVSQAWIKWKEKQ